MTTRTIKTVLFSAIILSLVIPVTGFSLAEAKVSEDKIPEDKLLKRGDDWKSKYTSLEEHDKSERSISTFVSDTHPDNKWNKQTKKNQIVIYNFDTKVGEKQAGLNALLVNVQNQKDNGTYNPTEAESRFHEWVAEQIDTPIMPDAKSKHIERVVEAYNSNANYGNVSTELIETDKEFWIGTATLKSCDLEKGCNPIELDIPFAAYATSSSHVLSTYVDAYACETGSCFYSDLDYGTGVLNTNQNGGSNHATVPLIYYYIYNIETGPSSNVSLEVSGTVQLGTPTENVGPKTGTNSVLLSGSEWFGYGGCGSQHCGVFNLSAQAEDATY